MIAKLIDLFEKLIDLIPPPIQGIIYKAGIGIAFLAGIFAIYQGIVSGQKAAQPVGIQMAKSTEDLLSDQTKRIRQKGFNQEDTEKLNLEYMDESENLQPNFQYKLKYPSTTTPPSDYEHYQNKKNEKFYDFDKLQPIKSNNYYLRETEQEKLSKEYSNRLLSRQKGILKSYKENNPYNQQSDNIYPKQELKNKKINKNTTKPKGDIKQKEKGKFKYTSPQNQPLILE